MKVRILAFGLLLLAVIVALIPISAGAQSPLPTPTFTPTSVPPTAPPPTAPPPTSPPPATPIPVPTPRPTAVPPSGPILGYHVVRAGETLYCIARAYGVDPNAIARQNGIVNPSRIYVGQRLAIPNVPGHLPAGPVCVRQFGGGTQPPPSGQCRWHHTVLRGENLYRISLRYGVSIWAIARANNISNPNYIRAGQVLCIP